MASQAEKDLKVVQEDWMVKKWRPMMGWTYMATCLFDFILGPILYNVLQYLNPGQAVGMWTPLTLQGGGMYHLAMGAVLGVSAWSRGQEKMQGAADPKPEAPVWLSQPTPEQSAPQAAPVNNFAPPPAAAPADFSAPPAAPAPTTVVVNVTQDAPAKPTRKVPTF